MIESVIVLATFLHMGQVGKDGQPYIFHPLRVMEKARVRGGDIIVVAAAVLHDVLEDCSIEPEDLIANLLSYEFTPEQATEIVRVVIGLSKVEGESYPDFIRRCMEDPTVEFVKSCDLEDNYLRTLVMPPGPLRDRLKEKYEGAYEIMGLELPVT